MTQYRQIPQGEEVFLDHLAHFVPDMSAAEQALAGLGFVLTPFTEQRNRTPEGFVPAGTGNRCAMLCSGYLEFLTRCSDTPLARRLEAALERYTGVHLLAMTVADVDAGRAQLAREGFEPDEPVRLTRAVPLPEGGEGEGRFSVVRVPPDKMAEGRIQVLAHHTPDIVWQERWLAHENRIVSLEAVLLVVADPQEAAARYGRFLGREPVRLDAQRMLLRLDRGALVFVADPGPYGLPKALSMPWIAGYALGSEDRAASVACFRTGGAQPTGSASGDDWLALPAALGGHVAIGAPGALPGWAH